MWGVVPALHREAEESVELGSNLFLGWLGPSHVVIHPAFDHGVEALCSGPIFAVFESLATLRGIEVVEAAAFRVMLALEEIPVSQLFPSTHSLS
jgi:hypothetical protein